MPIYGGWNTTVWYGGSAPATPATNLGIITRPDPILDPALINVRGTGKRGLRDILLGLKDYRLTLDWVPNDTSFIRNYQSGAQLGSLHYLVAKGPSAVGITFTNLRVERLAVSCRAGDIVNCSGELAAQSIAAPDSDCPWGGDEVETPIPWHDTAFYAATKGSDPAPRTMVKETKWHEWRYEVRNNLERLPNVESKATRSLEQRHRDVSGMVSKDLEDFAEWLEFAGVSPDPEIKFCIWITEGSNFLLGAGTIGTLTATGAYSQWGRIGAPHGPEDLTLKRFPFTCKDLT